MPVMLANVLLSTARAPYSAATKVTGAALPRLLAAPAHLEPNTVGAFSPLPDAALRAKYYATLASGSDIAEGDVLTAITLRDGITPWPGLTVVGLGEPGASNVVWRVVYAQEAAALFLPFREVWVDYDVLGGPRHL